MGYNTVAVILNDTLGSIEKDAEIGQRITRAVQAWPGRRHRGDGLNVSAIGGGMACAGAMRIVSQDHASGEQVVVVHGNTGWPADDAPELTWRALDQMQRCLERHGYTVRKPKKQRPSPSQPKA